MTTIKQIIYFFILLAFPVLLWGKVIETNTFSDILEHIDTKETLIISDLDNTLMESTRHLGSTQWGEYLVKKLLTDGHAKTYDEAMLAVDPIWRKIQNHITVRPVDSSIPSIVKQLQEEGLVVLGLTSRLSGDAAFTRGQLHSIALDLNAQKLTTDSFHWLLKDFATYEQGILYCSYKNYKSEVLIRFLKEINYQPKRIIFVDDKWSHIKDLENALQSSGIEYIGVRYGGADERVQAFDPEIAEIQLNAIPLTLSDEQAATLKRSKSTE